MSRGRLLLRSVTYGVPDVRRLEAAVQQEYIRRYGEPDGAPIDAAEFVPPDGGFVVAYVSGSGGDRPIAMGGFRRHDAETAEIKRMYVVEPWRGRGIARLVLARLEDDARAAGYARTILETGTVQPEAVGLYTSSGYQPTANFGYYRDSPLSVCFAKELKPAH